MTKTIRECPAYEQATASSCAIVLCLTLCMASNLAWPDEETQTPSDTSKNSHGEVTVTARKISEPLFEVPLAITQFSDVWLNDHGVRQFVDYAMKIPNASFTYGGGPTGVTSARSISIRGVGGQNFLGTASAIGFYIDNTAVPSSVDPHLLDISAIEVLRGPQGTLYGASSLGGNVRLITQPPNFTQTSLSSVASAGATRGSDGFNGGLGIVSNVALSPETLAVRMSIFGEHQAGYLTRSYPSDPNSGGATDPFLEIPRTNVDGQAAKDLRGGSMSIYWKTSRQFDMQIRLMHQEQKSIGFPATFAPLPSFTPEYRIDRAFDIQPYATDRWNLASANLSFRGGSWEVMSSTSYFMRNAIDVEDATYGTQQILRSYYGLPELPPQPFMWTGARNFRQLSQELRAHINPNAKLRGQAGFFYARTHSTYETPPTYAKGLVQAAQSPNLVGIWPDELLWTIHNPSKQRDLSLFGEVDYRATHRLSITAGIRKYWLRQTIDNIIDGYLNFGSTTSAPQTNSQSGTSPKISVAYMPKRNSLVYASATKGFRSGGAQASLPFCSLSTLSTDDITHLESDTLWTYEGGIKLGLPVSGLAVSAAVFKIDWDHFQQLITLPCGAFVSVNGDSAQIEGAEFDISQRLWQVIQVRLAAGYERSRAKHPGNLAIAGLTPGSQLPGIPQWTSSIDLEYAKPIGANLTALLSADYSYRGESTSLLNAGAGAIAVAPAYHLINARIGIRWKQSELALTLRNLTNQKPNLGDIGYNGYAQFGAAGVAGGLIPTVATTQPFTVLMNARHTFQGRRY